MEDNELAGCILGELQIKQKMIEEAGQGGLFLNATLDAESLRMVVENITGISERIRGLALEIVEGLSEASGCTIDHTNWSLCMGRLWRLSGENTFSLVSAAERIAQKAGNA